MITLTTALVMAFARPTAHDFRCDATRLETLLKRLSDVTGETMTASGALAGEPLMIDMTGRSAEEIRSALARCLEAEWTRQGDKWLLGRTPAQQAAIKAAHDKAVESQVAAGLAKLLEDRPVNDWSDEAARKAVESERQFREKLIGQFGGNMPEGARATVISSAGVKGPASLVLDAALRLLSPARLARMGNGARVAFSTARTSRQEGLPGSIASAVQAFVKAHNSVVAVSRSLPSQDDRVMFEGSLDLDAKPISDVGKVIVGVERDYTGNVFSVEAVIYGPDMRVLGKSNASFSVSPPEQPEPAVTGGRHKWSATANEIVSVLNQTHLAGAESRSRMNLAANGMFLSIGSDDIGMTKDFSAPVWQALTSPADVDPLALFVGEAVGAWCKTKSSDYVARVPDALFDRAVSTYRADEVELTQVESSVVGSCTTSIEEGVQIVRPKDSFSAESERCNRPALQALVRAAASKYYLTLDEQLDYIRVSRARAVRDSLDMVCLSLVAPDCAATLERNTSSSFWLMNVLAAAPASAATLKSGVLEAKLASLSAGQVTAIEEAVYNHAMGPRMVGEGTMVAISVEQGEPPAEPTASDLDPTEAFPNGLPADLLLRVNVSDFDAVLATVPKTRLARIFTAEALGAYLGITSSPDVVNNMPNLAHYTLFQAAALRSFEGEVTGKSQLATAMLPDGRTVPGNAVPLDQLSPAFQAQVKAAREEALKNEMRFGPRRGGPIKP